MNRKQRGSVTVEIAFILPVILMLILIFFEVGRIKWHFATLDHVVHEATREASRAKASSAEELAENFELFFFERAPSYASSVEFETVDYQNIHHWLTNDLPEENVENAAQRPVLEITVRVQVAPMSIPYLEQHDNYIYRKMVALVPEKDLEPENR